MTKNQICIVIPIYKTELSFYEQQSVMQCLKVLSDYVIYFIAPNKLDTSWYSENYSLVNSIIRFDDFFFRNLTTYNKLMLNVEFYESFLKHEYMLIYQPDCYVFSDQLLDWAKKDYDYIGSIWFENYHGNPKDGAKLWYAGNGGLSLRKISKMISILTSTKSTLGISGVIKNMPSLKDVTFGRYIKEWMQLPIKLFGYKNNTKYLAIKHGVNEDVFFMESNLKYNQLSVPEVKEALLFGWDRCAAYLYAETNQLPFACHGWYRDEFPYEGNKDFWLTKIKLND